MSDIIHVDSVSISPKESNLIMKGSATVSEQFTAKVLPENATNKDVLFGLDNTHIGFIDENGKFTATGSGSGTITVTTVDGLKTDTATVNVFSKPETPPAPIITNITQTTLDIACDPDMVFSIDGGNVWDHGPMLINLEPKKEYNIICKILANEEHLESDISNNTSVRTPDVTPDPKVSGPSQLTLSSHSIIFDLSKNKFYTLNYAVLPNNTNNEVYWYSDDDSIVRVNSSGELIAEGIGTTRVYVKSIFNGIIYDYCECTVNKTIPRPNPPILKEVTTNSIEIYEVYDCEYSLDKVNWQNETLFAGLEKNKYYYVYQRTKGKNVYIQPSVPSYALTVKTLNDETPGGESESGYTWGQEVELNKINIYVSPYATKSDLVLSGKYYIFNLIETNHRIRITDDVNCCGTNGQSIGWANIADLKLIENIIYVGDKVVVNGDINIYSDGSGTFIHKNKQIMYVTDIIDGQEYSYGVTTKPGMSRQGFAKPEQVTKYKVINIDT